MPTNEPTAISDVLESVRAWSPSMRIVLARKVLETLESAEITEPPRMMCLEDVVGLLQTDSPPPDDDGCGRIIEQERTRKYG